MTREMFVQVASQALRLRGVDNAEEHAEAIAALMDTVGRITGEPAAMQPRGAPGAPFPGMRQPGTPPQPFPEPNPEAIVAEVRQAPLPEPLPEPRLIIPATTIPDKVERVVAPKPEPVRSLRPPAEGGMKVEDLNQLIQDRTPQHLMLDVPMGDGSTRRVIFERNVISRHAFDAVQLVYSPPGTLPATREAVEVQANIALADLPVDLGAILHKLREEAIVGIRPRRIPRSVEPEVNLGPVQNTGRVYEDGSSPTVQDATTLQQTQAVFGGLG
ncbi:MAG: hypothetical protein ACM34G_17290 [Acidobacteriota bacterium]